MNSSAPDNCSHAVKRCFLRDASNRSQTFPRWSGSRYPRGAAVTIPAHARGRFGLRKSGKITIFRRETNPARPAAREARVTMVGGARVRLRPARRAAGGRWSTRSAARAGRRGRRGAAARAGGWSYPCPGSRSRPRAGRQCRGRAAPHARGG